MTMPTTERLIEKLLRRSPAPPVPEGLHERLRADMRAAIPDIGRRRSSPVVRWRPGLAFACLLIGVMASGAGLLYLAMPRTRHYDQVPAERLRDVAEPFVPQDEDLQPIPPTLHRMLLDLREKAGLHREATGERTRYSLFGVQADGTVFCWHDGRPELMRSLGYRYHASQHPNDFRCTWSYNLDASPVQIKSVTPHHAQQWKPGEVKDEGLPVSDGYSNGAGYWVELERPKTDEIIDKWLLDEDFWAREKDGRWEVTLGNVQMSGDQYICFAIHLPAGAIVLSVSRPAKSQTVGQDGSTVLVFEESLTRNGYVKPVTVTYSLEKAQAAN